MRTWREKLDSNGSPIWLRRSRFVAREFAWLQPERESLFSPASSAITSRILSAIFLEMRSQCSAVLASLDVKDAFLTVDQQEPTLVHTTDAAGNPQSFSLGKVLPGQRDGSLLWYSAQVIERPGDELSFLKRAHVLHADGRMTIQTHHKHVQQMCSLLKMNGRIQSKKSPGHADMDKEDNSKELDAIAGTTFRTCVGILMYLASDLPHCQHVVRHLSTYSARPTEKSMCVLRHLVGYLSGHSDLCRSLKWDGRCSGVYHQQYSYDAGESVLEVFTDSDWASDRQSRRSVSCCLIFYGRCLLYAASRTQKVISLSSAEAEVYACSSGCSDAILLSKLISWLNGRATHIHLYTDSSGARGILQRMGVGRLRHLSCRILWLQQLIANGTICVAAVSGHSNPADIGTKRLGCSRMRSLMAVLGVYNQTTQSVEGSDDPGRVFVRKLNIRTLISALSLLQLQGCDLDGPDETSSCFKFACTAVVGVFLLLPWIFPNMFSFCGNDDEPSADVHSAQVDLDDGVQNDEPVAMDDLQAIAQEMEPDGGPVAPAHLLAAAQDMHPMASSSDAPLVGHAAEPLPEPGTYEDRIPQFTCETMPPINAEWFPEALIVWLYDRCSGRLMRTNELRKQHVYHERMLLLLDLMVCLRNFQVTRLEVYNMLLEIDDLSEDENSPSHELSHQGRLSAIHGAQRAFDFGSNLMRALQVRTYPPESSIHVDTVARQLAESFNSIDDGESSEELEDAEQRRERYIHSFMSEVSDPEYWMDIHHGDAEVEESDAG